MNYTNRPIAAYTMAEFESLTSDNADFARGKDKKKRKSRAGLYAGIGAGALALGAPAVRYGGAEVMSRMAGNKMKKSGKARHPELLYGKGYSESGGGAKGALGRDVQSVKDMGNRVKGAAGSAFDKVKNADYKGMPGKFGSMASRRAQQAAALATSAPGLAVLGAGAAAAGGYGIYKAMKKGKKK
jgi:hypothetical protein